MDYLRKNLAYLSTLPGKGQIEIERATELKQPAISKIKSGKTGEAGYRTVAKLAAFYEVSIDDLVTRDIESFGRSAPSQSAGLDDATMAQGVELLYLLADARPEDNRLKRPSWAMLKIAGKAVHRAKGDPRTAMAEILAELAKVV